MTTTSDLPPWVVRSANASHFITGTFITADTYVCTSHQLGHTHDPDGTPRGVMLHSRTTLMLRPHAIAAKRSLRRADHGYDIGICRVRGAQTTPALLPTESLWGRLVGGPVRFVSKVIEGAALGGGFYMALRGVPYLRCSRVQFIGDPYGVANWIIGGIEGLPEGRRPFIEGDSGSGLIWHPGPGERPRLVGVLTSSVGGCVALTPSVVSQIRAAVRKGLSEATKGVA